MRLLVCGSRTWVDEARVFAEIDALAPTSIVHGAAPGADTIASRAPGRAGSTTNVELPYPADWERDGRAAGPKRNARMLAEGKPNRGLAFGALWKRDTFSRSLLWRHTGTGDMVAKMLRAGLLVRWVASPGAAAVDLTRMPGPPR